jgi:hypothetical protein
MMAAAQGTRRKAPGGTVASRIAGERPPVRPGDGRSKRATGRSKQLNLKVMPEVDAEFRALAKAEGKGFGEMFETIFAEWKAARR